MDSKVDLANRTVRFMKLLPNQNDNTLVILKGHLLVEELITAILKESLNKCNPIGILINERTQFNKMIELLWALHPNRLENASWTALKKLNTIRNLMAHNIEPKGLSDKIDEFTKIVLPISSFDKKDYIGYELKYSISWLYILLNQMLYDVKNS